MTDETKRTRVSFISLGCFKNLVDTEVLGGMLEKKNIDIVSDYEETDWLVINTCGFVRDAKEESIAEILEALEKKSAGEIPHVAVFGCLTQRYHAELSNTFSGADIIWGVNDLEELASIIVGERQGGYRDRNPFLYDHRHHRILTTTPNTTFLKISEGCSMPCSFCAIPLIRGPYRSRDIASIVEEARGYRERGFHELNLISQNTTFFGREGGGPSRLPDLLAAISELGFTWVRLLYLMPEEVDDALIEAFDLPSILPYFDLPFQHVAPGVLKRMKRGGGVTRNMRLIEKIRSRHPDAVIRSTFIVGFPGETEADHELLCRFARDAGIERIGVFGYSAEENTAAFGLDGTLPEETILARREMLMDISDDNMAAFNRRILTSRRRFLPLGPWENNSTVGRIDCQAPEVDGLTRVQAPFDEDGAPYEIRLTAFNNELLTGEKT